MLSEKSSNGKSTSPVVPRLALNQQEAAAALGVSVNFFTDEIASELAVVYRRRRRLYAVAELERWLQAQATQPLGASR